ncbi:MAG: preprotein translocase subunit YajC [Tissierellia bacterium]|nr:preprotein translocase subunit YajC [Tissierellia bacterium]
MNAQQFQPLIITIGFLAIFYFLVIRPQKKKEAQINEMRSKLGVGDEVITIGGIRGKIIKAKDDYITLEVGSAKTKLEMTRWAVGSVVKKNESKNKKDESKVEDSKTEEDNNEGDK